MIHIDGNKGEGGGQVLRASLALSLVSGKPFVIENIRGGRTKPGLLRQHYAAVKAAAQVSDAELSEVAVGSSRLEFHPKAIRAGAYQFSVGSAGSASLVMQTVLTPLLLADGTSTLELEGGTHNPMAPPTDFIQKTLLPCLSEMGANVSLTVDRFGFYPAGGGRFSVVIEPINSHAPLDLTARPERSVLSAVAYVSQIPESIGRRELKVLTDKLQLPWDSAEVFEVTDSIGPGNALMVAIESDHVTEVITGFGERGTSAERVAKKVANEVRRYLKSGAPVGAHLADQLIVPMAAGAGGRFRTLPPSRHLETVVEITRQFLDVEIKLEPTDEIAWDVEVTTS